MTSKTGNATQSTIAAANRPPCLAIIDRLYLGGQRQRRVAWIAGPREAESIQSWIDPRIADHPDLRFAVTFVDCATGFNSAAFLPAIGSSISRWFSILFEGRFALTFTLGTLTCFGEPAMERPQRLHQIEHLLVPELRLGARCGADVASLFDRAGPWRQPRDVRA